MYKNETFALTTTAAAHTTKTLSFVYILEGGNGKRTDYYKINKRHTIKQYLLHINNKLRSIFSRVYCGKGGGKSQCTVKFFGEFKWHGVEVELRFGLIAWPTTTFGRLFSFDSA